LPKISVTTEQPVEFSLSSLKTIDTQELMKEADSMVIFEDGEMWKWISMGVLITLGVIVAGITITCYCIKKMSRQPATPNVIIQKELRTEPSVIYRQAPSSGQGALKNDTHAEEMPAEIIIGGKSGGPERRHSLISISSFGTHVKSC
jgi:hypothetical protein